MVHVMTGYENTDDVQVLKEPVDYSSSPVPAPLDLTVHKTGEDFSPFSV